VKVTVVRAGGIAGLVTTVTADTAALGPADAESLRDLVGRAGLLAPPAATPPPPPSPPQPDRFDQEIVVDDDGRRAQLRVSDQDASAEVTDLVRFVRLVPGATQEVGPPA
jgi:hypothetical protein